MDLTGSEDNLERFRNTVGNDVVAISAVTGKGLGILTEKIWKVLQEKVSIQQEGSKG